jgi:hypothetical protein
MKAPLLLILMLAGCANVNASGTSRVSNPSCWMLCFERHVPVEARQ